MTTMSYAQTQRLLAEIEHQIILMEVQVTDTEREIRVTPEPQLRKLLRQELMEERKKLLDLRQRQLAVMTA